MAAILALLALAAPAGAAPVLQPGFELETVATGLTLPVGVTWAPDGRMFISEKDGILKVRKPDGTTDVVLDMRNQVNSFSDRGLLGIAVDRDFADNGEIYLYYPVEIPGALPDGPEPTILRLDRIAVDANSAVVAPPQTIVGTYQPPVDAFHCPRPHTNDVDCMPGDHYWHSVGTVRVDQGDGTIWLGEGDALAPPEGVPDPIAFRTFDEATYAGKIIHVDRNGRGVAGHPFCPTETDTTKVCTKLYAKGFRQPFRFTLRDTTPSSVPRTPEKGPVVGDVGWSAREEIDLVRPGRNYGWPCYEGRNMPSPYRETQTCVDLYAAQGADAATGPALHYHQRDAGGSVTGGTILQGSAYPDPWAGRLYYADYSNRWIRSAPVDPSSDSISDADDFRPDDFVTDAGGVVDLQADPNGNMTYVDITTGTVRRIVYTAGNRAPVAEGSATPTNGNAPLDVAFSSAGSSDPDGDPLTYQWDFGDGEPAPAEANPSHTYTQTGQFTATLTVSDSRRTAMKTFAITTYNNAPVAAVSGPSTYRGGVPVHLSATASDVEDGNISDDASFSWQVVLRHLTHEHFIGTLTGRGVDFTPQADHDVDSHYEVRLRVTDSGGLQSEVVKRLDPESVLLTLESVPPGAPFDYSGTSGEMPLTIPTAIGYSTTLSAAPTFVRDGATYAFESWSDGEPRTRPVTVPSAETTLVATYNGLPTAAFTAGPGTARSAMSFDPSASTDPDGDPLAYEWDFGDGSTRPHAARPAHSFDASGTYSVTLTVVDGRGGTASVTQAVRVGDPPPLVDLPPVGRFPPSDDASVKAPDAARPAVGPAVRLAASRSGLRVGRDGLLAVPLRNVGAREAFGSFTITTAERIAGRDGSRKRLTLVKRAFTIAPGGRVAVRVQLSAAEAALVGRTRRLPVVVAIKAGLRADRHKPLTHDRTMLLAPCAAGRGRAQGAAVVVRPPETATRAQQPRASPCRATPGRPR
jgi:PKD repeat protein/glucose/arabinose dehydrogenase